MKYEMNFQEHSRTDHSKKCYLYYTLVNSQRKNKKFEKTMNDMWNIQAKQDYNISIQNICSKKILSTIGRKY